MQNPEENKPKPLHIKLFANGFVIGDGPFRPFAEDSNTKFLAELRAGNVPEELRPLAVQHGGALPIEMAQFEGDYDPKAQPTGFTAHHSSSPSGLAPNKPSLFAGLGASLGGTSASSPAAAGVSSDIVGMADVDLGQPLTTLQIRLPGGTKVARKFNETTSGSVLLKLLSDALHCPQSSVVVSEGFPPRAIEHSDLGNKSLKDLGLCNSAVHVSLK